MNAPARLLVTPERLRLRVEDYMLLDESGAFADYTKTELIDGEIYVMNAQYSRHARTKSRLARLIGNRLEELGSDLEALTEVAVRISKDSMPEPDIVVTSWRGSGPVPVETVRLIVEVSESTLDIDLGRKCDLYAAAGVTEYWVIDLNENRALLHEHGDADGYHGQLDLLLGEPLKSIAIEGLDVSSAGLVD